MHPRSIYNDKPPDFGKLASKYDELKPYVRGNAVDFENDKAARMITRCLLLEDFDLDVRVPEDRLCPPIPNRLNYLLWLEDLLDEATDTDVTTKVTGIDIGTGACAIYPLLGCRLHGNWSFYALEVDDDSISHAKGHIEQNGLTEKIMVLKSDIESAALLTQHSQFLGTEPLAKFTICNPPFYESLNDIKSSADLKTEPATSICSGAAVEMITPGGEVEFIKKLVRDSLQLKGRIAWYSTMLGKLSSVQEIVKDLRSHSIVNFAITELIQGNTKRWAVAWSFLPFRPLPGTCRPESLSLRSYLPMNPAQVFEIAKDSSIDFWKTLLAFLDDHKLSWSWITIKKEISISVVQDTWSRQARRRLAKQQSGEDSASGVIMKIFLMREEDKCSVLLRYGLDDVLFTSLVGKLKSTLTAPSLGSRSSGHRPTR